MGSPGDEDCVHQNEQNMSRMLQTFNQRDTVRENMSADAIQRYTVLSAARDDLKQARNEEAHLKDIHRLF